MSDHFPDFSLNFFRLKIKREVSEQVSRQIAKEEPNKGLEICQKTHAANTRKVYIILCSKTVQKKKGMMNSKTELAYLLKFIR